MEIDIIQFLIIAVSILIVLIVVLFIPMSQEVPQNQPRNQSLYVKAIEHNSTDVIPSEKLPLEEEPLQDVLLVDNTQEHTTYSSEQTSLHIVPSKKSQPRPPKLLKN